MSASDCLDCYQLANDLEHRRHETVVLRRRVKELKAALLWRKAGPTVTWLVFVALATVFYVGARVLALYGPAL